MQIEVYKMAVNSLKLEITLEAVCDSFSSLLWDVEYYSCGSFEVYIAATPENLGIFKAGRIVGRSDDKQHYGIIEKIHLNADAENGDYLTVSGRFLMSLLARRIIFYTLNFTSETPYHEIIRTAVWRNCLWDEVPGNAVRKIPGLQISDISSPCWQKTAHLQISNENLMDWIYQICEIVGGTANIRLQSTENGGFSLVFELSEGTDRSIQQDENPHVIFSDTYNNLLSFDYVLDCTEHSNFAYIYGEGEGAKRKHTSYFPGYIPFVSTQDDIPSYLDRYEIYVDARDLTTETQDENGETSTIPNTEYYQILRERGAEKLMPITEKSESTIAVNNRQYQYNKDYFLGDYVTVEHQRFGLKQPKIQLVGMIESFDQNGYSLTPTFKGA
ncbi:MAG: siphovirus ReqiPepy6 Gp37-like family protein [Lachnospiraceae bacterium]|nr:siphovirus ReqiPepy6 Gp37-like family protein [Lachnospiraceae bacterium]MCM1229995.1 siphovirus ReqiPepy6 Gp37-like family protein [Ruminococcus flavefaciens]